MIKKLCACVMALVMATMCLLISGCASKENTETEKYTHAFSVSATTQVYFASGNLQYCPATGKWRFAEHAYDTVGEANELASSDYEGWLDLFCWGATGLSGVAPYCTTRDNLIYGDGHRDIAGTDWDFSRAYDEQNGGNWRMFTHDEIHYLLMYRENAEKLFGYGTVDGIRGLFLLPDDWVCPDGIAFTPATETGFENQYNWYYTNGEQENYAVNVFSTSDWEKIEAAGCVFLPATGMRGGTECDHVGLSGHYWTSSYYGEEFANCLCLFEHDLFLEGNFDRSTALGVRLVKDAVNETNS